MSASTLLTIGKLAKLTGTTAVTIRFYAKHGLLPKSKRSEGGYRLYPEDVIPRFHFIRNAKSVGFSLEEIKILLDLQKSKNSTSKHVRDTTIGKIEEIKTKIDQLKKMQKALESWVNVCDGKVSIDKCPILENLYKE
ncbi:MAG: heavy metal-responsive transcriptional regulator [Legionellales bacterium]|nr:heavy metal-responsive transcriptional regulator [Legionellales bacterium]